MTSSEDIEHTQAVLEGSAVIHPAHYNTGKIEAWDAIYAWGLNFHRGSAVKYIARAGHKGDAAKEIEDLEKARFYLEDEIARLKGDK